MMKLEHLTDCEELVMKTVWDAEKELGLTDIAKRVNEAGHKNWKPQTVSTFLARLVRKGYLEHYRQGRVFFYRILIPKRTYVGRRTNIFIELWCQGNASVLLAALMESRALRTEEKEEIRRLVSEQ